MTIFKETKLHAVSLCLHPNCCRWYFGDPPLGEMALHSDLIFSSKPDYV